MPCSLVALAGRLPLVWGKIRQIIYHPAHSNAKPERFGERHNANGAPQFPQTSCDSRVPSQKSSRSLALDIRSGAAEQQPGLKRLQNNVEVHDVAVSTGPGMNKAVHDLDKFALENR
mmetsp:Transcript_9424/g.17769  ORF Transcript_9424/g.17769 Transcript_9424/m.17769 type:complete len:117 (-) Transcript_9424:2026-2376(-)